MSDLKQQAWSVISKLDGWADESRVNMLIDLVLNHKPKVIVEIGIFGGRSLFAMAFALRHLGQGYVVGIDPWSKEAACEGESEKNIEWWSEKVDLEKIYSSFVQNVLALKLTKECRWIRATAEEAAPLFRNESIDLLSLDSNHSELVSCRQVTEWLPRIAPRGVILMDDVHWPSQAKALNMIRESGLRTMQEIHNSEGAWAAFQKP